MANPDTDTARSIVPRGTIGDTAVHSCPICNGSEFVTSLSVRDHFLSNEVFTLRDCTTCGLRITSPIPKASDLARYYQTENYLSHASSGRTFLGWIYHQARVRAIRTKFALIERFHSSGRALDIGCGTGDFLNHLSGRGFICTGVEPSAKAREIAIQRHGLTVLEDLDQVSHSHQFQVITLWHVLEHLPDPRTVMKQIHARAADGALVVIAVPDRASWDARFFGATWAAWDVPRHLVHYRSEDVTRLIQEHGFRLVRTQAMWMDAYYISLLSLRYQGWPGIMAWPGAVLLGTLSNLKAWATKRPTSSTCFLAVKDKV